MLAKYRLIIQRVEMLSFCNQKDPNGNDIANEMMDIMSRATTYRWLDKMRKIGLLVKVEYHNEIQWSVALKGQEFMGMWNELPF